MDQVRTIAKIIWQQRFWLLIAIGLIAAIICWNIAAGDLQDHFSKRISSIDLSFTSMRNVNDVVNHPNENVNDGDRQQVVAQREQVLKLWNELYQHQRDEVLFWPPESLDASFIQEISRLKFLDEFPARNGKAMRDNYRNYIQYRFDDLLKIVKAKKGDQSGRARPGKRRAQGAPSPTSDATSQKEEDYLVTWIDQDILRKQLIFDEEPSEIQIWVTQEDLWVYETLLNVIKNTNEQRGATRPDNAAVQEITALQVGKPAIKRMASTIYLPQTPGLETPFVEEPALNPLDDPSGESFDPAVMFLSSRYLDKEGIPHFAEDAPFGQEFRQLPIRMLLRMDQRAIPQILVECANAALPVEVKQLRINPSSSGEGFAGGSSGGRQASRKQSSGNPNDTNLAEVEIRAVVYIYNEPNEEELKVPGEDAA